jgi:peptidyl-prolyl cis-trans isomerase C
VFVDTLISGRVPVFEEVEADVKKAWLAEQKAQAWQKAYQGMRAKYTVLLPAPAENAPASGDTSRSKQIPVLSGEGGS